MPFDWKFFATMIAAVAGVLVPLWLWQVDLTARSLSLRLASSVALQPAGSAAIPDLQVSIGGAKLESPFLSTIELSNDGSKAIAASDFESPIELNVGQNTKIVRARVLSADPKDVRPELDTSSGSISIKPLLLNPKDSLTIAVITSGSAPTFVARSRVAGISKIKFDDTTAKKINLKTAAAQGLIALMGVVLYFAYAATLTTSLRFRWPVVVATMLCCGLLSAVAVRRSYEAAGADFSVWPFTVVSCVLGTIIYWRLVRKARRDSSTNAG